MFSAKATATAKSAIFDSTTNCVIRSTIIERLTNCFDVAMHKIVCKQNDSYDIFSALFGKQKQQANCTLTRVADTEAQKETNTYTNRPYSHIPKIVWAVNSFFSLRFVSSYFCLWFCVIGFANFPRLVWASVCVCVSAYVMVFDGL